MSTTKEPTVEEKIKRLRELREEAKLGGGKLLKPRTQSKNEWNL